MLYTNYNVFKQKKTIMSTGVYVIGNNEYGELAFGNDEHITSLTPASFNLSKQINDIHCGYQYTIFSDSIRHKLYSAGWNCGIEINDKFITEITPIKYFNDIKTPIVKICANISGCCTFWITENNRLYGQGLNEHWQLGLSDDKNRLKPTLIDALTFVKDVKSSALYSIALCTSGINIIIANWGSLLSMRSLPVEIVELIILFHGNNTKVCIVGNDINDWSKITSFDYKQIIQIDSGRYHSLFLQSDGTLYSFGDNAQYQLGIPASIAQYRKARIPVRIGNITKVKDIACGWYHNLIITIDRRIYSWGYNNFGQCGVGNLHNVKIPKLISSLKKYKMKTIVCGAYHSGAVTMNNKCFLFGSNKYNECINGNGDRVVVPSLINYEIQGEGNYTKFIKRMYLGYHNTKLIVCSE
eukprot:223335_1